MQFLQDFNQFFCAWISYDIWNMIQIISSIILLIGCILQRVHLEGFKSNSMWWYLSKIGQIGLFGQMMMAILAIVDGYYSIQIGHAHVIIALWALSSAMVKYTAYNFSFKKNIA